MTESVPESNGTTGYDAINRLLEKDQVHGSSTFAYEKYGYDSMSRITTVTREDGKQDTLGYNLNGEMTSANYQWQNNRSVSYTLDKAGNRTGVVDAGVTKYYSPDNINRYTTADSTTANSNNVGSGPEHQVGVFQGYTYEYIGDSYVTTIYGAGLGYNVHYDALGRCVYRALNSSTTYYVYDGEKPILEYTSTGAIAGKNVYGKGIDEIVMRTDYVKNPSGLTYYYQEDHEGSVTHLTNASGGVIESYRYDAFGAPTITTANGVIANNRFMFTGREYNQQFGIYEYRARTYHPGLGRFLSEDPKGFDAGDYNLFRYCKNDPEDLTDAMGLSSNSGTDEPYQLQWTTGSHIPERVPTGGDGGLSFGQVDRTSSESKKSVLVDKEGNRSSGEHFGSQDTSASTLTNRAYAEQQNSGDAPVKRTEYYGYGAQNNTNTHDNIIFGPYRGDKEVNKNVNKSNFSPSDPSPDGYHRTFVVYTHTNSRDAVSTTQRVDPRDQVQFRRLQDLNRIHVYLIYPPAPGARISTPTTVIWP